MAFGWLKNKVSAAISSVKEKISSTVQWAKSHQVLKMYTRLGLGFFTKEVVVATLTELVAFNWLSSSAALASPWLYLIVIAPVAVEGIMALVHKSQPASFKSVEPANSLL